MTSLLGEIHLPVSKVSGWQIAGNDDPDHLRTVGHRHGAKQNVDGGRMPVFAGALVTRTYPESTRG